MTGCTEGDLRLLESSDSSRTDGHVEVCRSNVWGTVCADGWSNADAQVVCRQLGLNPHGRSTYYGTSFFKG